MSKEAADARYYPQDVESAIEQARERVEEWEWADDPHGYCHSRPMLVALLGEIERLRHCMGGEDAR